MVAAGAAGSQDASKKAPDALIQASTEISTPPVRSLQACYFILGMGLLAACCSIWQCMDYMKALYGNLHPSRVLSTAYNMTYMVVVFAFFFGGPTVWPNKRGRLLTGYGLFVLAIAAPPLIDNLCNRFLPAGPSLQAVLAVWAVGAAVAGGADAVCSSVIYVQAASLGSAYTHAFLGGKAACGLIMAAIRCASKAALPGKSMQHLQLGTAVFLAVGALLVALCVFIIGVLLPWLQAGMDAESLPPTLTIQQTLIASQSIAVGSMVPRRARLLPFSNTLSAMQPGMSGAMLLPVFTASLKRTATGAMSFELSKMDTHVGLQGAHTSRLLAPMGTMEPAWSNAHWASMRRRRTMSVAARPNSASKAPQHGDSGPSASSIADTLPPGQSWRGASASSSHASPPRGQQLLQQVLDDDHVTVYGSALSRAPEEEEEAPSSPRGLFGRHVSKPQGSSSSSSSIKAFLGHYRPSIAKRSIQHSSSLDDVDTVHHDDELHHHSPFFVTQPAHDLQTVQEKEALEGVQEGGVISSPSLMESLRAVWLTMTFIYPFQLAVFAPTLITASILPMVFALDYSNSVLGSWYVQVAAVAFQLGGFTGSALMPVPSSLQRPKATLLTASAAMLSFVGAFVCSLKLNGGPITMVVLAFFMYMYSGYLNSCTFCLAGKGLLADDAQMVQMVLVLSTAVSFVLGGFISWAWLAVKV